MTDSASEERLNSVARAGSFPPVSSGSLTLNIRNASRDLEPTSL